MPPAPSLRAPLTLTVQPAGLQVVANNQTMTFGGSEPPLTVSYYGFVNGENTGVLGGSLACATTPATITATTPIGDYPINCSGLSSSNYTIYYVAGTLHIVTPSPNISASPMPSHSPLGSTFSISAIKGASSNPIVYSVDSSTTDNACTVSATGVVSFVKTNYFSGAANCVIDLNQAGDGTYLRHPRRCSCPGMPTTLCAGRQPGTEHPTSWNLRRAARRP